MRLMARELDIETFEAGADALRTYEMSGRVLRSWKDLPEHVKAKWKHKAMAVLEAIEKHGGGNAACGQPNCPVRG